MAKSRALDLVRHCRLSCTYPPRTVVDIDSSAANIDTALHGYDQTSEWRLQVSLSTSSDSVKWGDGAAVILAEKFYFECV